MSGIVRTGHGLALALLVASSAVAQTRSLPLRASALVAEPLSGRLYAALPAEAGPPGNSVVPIDPVSATVGAPVFVGSDPSVLAATDDGQFLYVGFTGTTSVRRFDVASNTAGPLYPLRRDPARFEPEFAVGLGTVPGQPHTIVVGQAARSTKLMRLVVLDDGVPRPVSPPERFDAFVVADATTVVASTLSHLYRLRLDASGLTVDAQLYSPSDIGPLLGVSDSLVFTSRAVFDLQRMRELRVRVPRQPTGWPVAPMVASGQGRYYDVAGGALVAQSLDTFDILGSTALDTQLGEPRALVSLGGGMAYLTDLPRVVLVGDFAAPPPVPVRTSGPTAHVELSGCVACRPGEVFHATATVGNTGPRPMRVEVKAQLTRWNDLAIDLSPFGGRHGEITLPPGTRTLSLLRGIVPPGRELFGDWRVVFTLVDPVSGRTYATASQTFTIRPF